MTVLLGWIGGDAYKTVYFFLQEGNTPQFKIWFARSPLSAFRLPLNDVAQRRVPVVGRLPYRAPSDHLSRASTFELQVYLDSRARVMYSSRCHKSRV